MICLEYCYNVLLLRFCSCTPRPKRVYFVPVSLAFTSRHFEYVCLLKVNIILSDKTNNNSTTSKRRKYVRAGKFYFSYTRVDVVQGNVSLKKLLFQRGMHWFRKLIQLRIRFILYFIVIGIQLNYY